MPFTDTPIPDEDRLARSGEVPCDWAVNTALDIMADFHGRSASQAIAMIADRLRLVRSEGFADGIRESGEPFK